MHFSEPLIRCVGVLLLVDLVHTYTVEYRQSAPHRLSAPPPLFFHTVERIGIVNAPPLVYPPPPAPPPPPLFRASSFSLSRIRPRRSRPVGVAVVVRQWRGSKHFCKHDVPSQLQRYLSTAAALHGRRTHTV